MSDMKLILASKSQGRKNLFDGLGLPFEVHVSKVDESEAQRTIKDSKELVLKLAELKSKAVAKNYDDAIVVGGDTIGFFEGKLIGKPKDKNEAKKIMRELSNKSHKFVSGFCIINTKTGEIAKGYDETELLFRNLSEKEIERFAENKLLTTLCMGYDVRDKISQLFIKKISGSYTSIQGLPMEKIIPILKEMGLDI